jgi:hypothetical protein
MDCFVTPPGFLAMTFLKRFNHTFLNKRLLNRYSSEMPAPDQVEGRYFTGLILCVAALIVGTILFPRNGFCQLTHLDTILAKKTAIHIDSLGNVNFAGDSGLSPILHILGTSIDRSRQTVIVEHLSATVTPSDSTGLMAIAFRGNLLRQNGLTAVAIFWNDTSLINLSKSDEQSLETNSPRYVHIERAAPKTFWEKTAEPVLVVLGAILIAALFYLVRS